MPPRDLFELEDSEAEAYFAAYRAAAPERLGWLEREVAGLSLDRTPESLVPLWRWFVSWYDARADAEPDVDGLPMWYEPDPAGATALPPAVLWIVDAIGYYLGEVVAAHVPGVHWVVAKSAKRLRYADRNRPVLKGSSGARLSPVNIVYVAALKVVLDGYREEDELLRVFRIWEKKLEAATAAR